MNTIILGLDAFDPAVFERLYEQGRLPNLAKFVQSKNYSRFAVSNPPQSEVSWTSIATGLNPGEHGLFDFVHRDPASYSLSVSLLPTQKGLGGTRFVPPFNARTIFDQAVGQGYPAAVLWWPATFPARPGSPVQTIPGLGTPDILGRLGVGTHFSTARGQKTAGKIPSLPFSNAGQGGYSAQLSGPMRKRHGRVENATVDFELDMGDVQNGRLKIGRQSVDLPVGRWSEIIELSFKMNRFVSVRAITRFILTSGEPDINLYALPLQLHPLHTPWPYGTPGRFVKKTWQAAGPFLTLGWPQDTIALEEGCINDEQFLALCESIAASRERAFFYHLDHYQEGILACVFDTLDRVQHMFWRDRPGIVESWYEKLDGLVGRVERRLAERGLTEKVRLVIVSDHGFARFDQKVHLNRWLIDRGYLAARENGPSGNLQQVDWARSQAYSLGLNSIYLNRAGREGQGQVQPAEIEPLLARLAQDLEQWRGPDGRPVVRKAYQRSEALRGKLIEFGPDMLAGFSAGYRASQENGLGAWAENSLEPNSDHWGGDHCMDPAEVPGVIFTSHNGLHSFSNPSYRDFPAIAVDVEPDASGSGPPPTPRSGEDDKIIEERLKSLGYL